jgi:adenylate cyclase
MGREIERKFLVVGDSWRAGARGRRFSQGYLCGGPPAAVRVRIDGDRAFLNIKQAILGIARDEFEYEIPVADAEAILARLCIGQRIEKTRYIVRYGGLDWEVDEFTGDNLGLIVAEIELDDERQALDLPPWAGEEVSHDVRYYNSSLAVHPYREWK